MIKAAGRIGHIPLLILGLSRLNTERLLAGKPVMVDTVDLGAGTPDATLPRVRVLLMAGETESDITAELARDGLLRETNIREDPNPV